MQRNASLTANDVNSLLADVQPYGSYVVLKDGKIPIDGRRCGLNSFAGSIVARPTADGSLACSK